MEYDIGLSVIFYICGSFYMFFGIYTLIFNTKSLTNWQFLLLTLSMSVWSFAYSFSASAPTAEASAFWGSFSVFGWGVFYSFFLHFVLTLTKTDGRLYKPTMLILYYLPAVISIILFAPYGYFAEIQYELAPSDSGWKNFLSANIGQIWIALYSSIYSVTSFILLIRWWKKIDPRSPLKRYVTYFLISIIISFFAGSITDIFSHVLGITQIPKLAIVLLVLPTIFLFITLRKFGVLLERTRTEFSPLDPKDLQEENRLSLFQTAAAIFAIGAAGSFFTGYFIGGGDFISEFLLAVFVWIFAVFLLFIPHISKKHTIQNTLFLITSIVGMTFFIIKDVNIGAATVWAVYIVFLLYSIVLDSKVHTFIFLVFTLITQVVLWIFFPEVSAIMNNAQYLKRIFIIVLSYFAVRYLTNEYASKLNGYKRFAKEQEILEKISSNFIYVNNENVIEKIDEMFEISAETLDFDQGYLIDFSADYENAIIVNAHARDGAVESLSFQPGVKVKTAAFPMAKALIAQKHPIGCQDITDLPIGESGEERKFFESRGILSYYALPITLENKVIGMLVIEDRRKADLRVRYHQTYFLGMIANILGDTRKKILYEEKLYDYAYFDETTKLANRNMLRKNIEQFLHNRKESEKLVIFDIELDNLRMINDSFGHNIGDQVIIKSASILESLMKEGCALSRIAEGKFIVVMPFAETTEEIEECANKIADAFSNPILPGDGIESLFVTIAIGIAVYPDDGRDVDALLQNADLAGYEAKSSDNKIVFCSDQLKNRVSENTLLTNRLFMSMQNDEFSLEFQPQISCRTGKTAGVEALLRWNYDDKRRIPPDIFIPMLEQTGLIHDVGLWVLEQALQEHNRLVSKGFPALRFSVNLSIAQFRKEDFILDILRLIKESKVDPKYVELEITESLLSKNFPDTIEKLYNLKDAGINIAIDDFGKGYSSLHRLELVPFNRIKIDKSIVDDITLETKKIVIVKTIVSLAKALMADITAEGVETKEQLEFMRDIGSDEIQGYYFSRPLPAEALEEFLIKE